MRHCAVDPFGLDPALIPDGRLLSPHRETLSGRQRSNFRVQQRAAHMNLESCNSFHAGARLLLDVVSLGNFLSLRSSGCQHCFSFWMNLDVALKTVNLIPQIALQLSAMIAERRSAVCR
eukprot:2933535-Pleurochrysis_carterae.AAC.1